MKAACIALIAGVMGCAFVESIPAVEAAGYTEKVVWSFVNGTDGRYPEAGLLAVKGTLYGTTVGGGTGCQPSGCGTVFSLNPNTGKEKVIYSFCSQQNCVDGADPFSSLIVLNGTLYGTTENGGGTGCGGAGCGTVFSVDLNTGTETVLYSFCGQPNCTDGANPTTNLIAMNGTLYGTTGLGGGYGSGTVFSLDLHSGAETVLHSFGSGTDGRYPDAGLINVNGVLYGTTNAGGSDCANNSPPGCGTVFSLNPNTGAETVLYSFCSQQNCMDGAIPVAGLIVLNGTLYGTTTSGGNTDCEVCGTVFALDPDTGAETVLHSFGNGMDGAYPLASLINVKGMLYGTTQAGGTGHNFGTAFALDPMTRAETVLYSFCSRPGCADGKDANSAMIDVNGNLYGTTTGGGSGGGGTVFMLKKNP